MARSERVLSSLRSLCRQVGRKEILDGFNGFSTEEIRQILGNEVSLAEYEVIAWIRGYIEQQYE